MIILRQKTFSKKEENREKLEEDYKEASKKVQDMFGKGTGVALAIPSAALGGVAGSKLGEKMALNSKTGKKAAKEMDEALVAYVNSKSPSSRGDLKKLGEYFNRADKVRKIGKVGSRVGAGIGIAGGLAAGYAGGKYLSSEGIKRSDKKFIKNATDDQLKKSTKIINDSFKSKKKEDKK